MRISHKGVQCSRGGAKNLCAFFTIQCFTLITVSYTHLDVYKRQTYAMAVLEVNASMGLIVAAPTAGSAGVVPGMMLALQECYRRCV